MSKDVSFEPRERMVKGIDIVANAVGGTLGPAGRNVYIDDSMIPKFTNDGASIANQMELEDKLVNAGAKLVRNTCGQTNDNAGDGTTTTAVLFQSIVHECLKRPENPMVIRESLFQASKKVIAEIKKSSTKIDKKDIKRVALISAENEMLAKNISEIINKIGESAVITVDDSNTFDTSYEIVEGYEANVGFMSPFFINEQKRARCVMTDVPVFVTDKKISGIMDIKPLFDQFDKDGITSCVIVAQDVDDTILGVFVRNFIASKVQGTFKALVIRATGDVLKDIEASVGATRVGDTTGVTFQMVDIKKHLGFVKKVVSDANKSLFIPKSTTAAQTWASHLQKFAKEEPNLYIKERLEKRIAQLKGGIAVLKIGGSDYDREYLKDKADDAIKASKSALEEGIVEGGGITLYRISQAMKPKTVGEEILKKALTAPLRKILENAGKDYTEIIKDMPKGLGYDAKNDKYVDMIETGIIDPAKVTLNAVANSVSNAASMVTMFASITDGEPKKDK